VRLTTLLDSLNEGTPGSHPIRSTALTSLTEAEEFDQLVATLIPCREYDAELWFAESTAEVELAKALCRECPVREGCLAGAVARQEPWGVWGVARSSSVASWSRASVAAGALARTRARLPDGGDPGSTRRVTTGGRAATAPERTSARQGSPVHPHCGWVAHCSSRGETSGSRTSIAAPCTALGRPSRCATA